MALLTGTLYSKKTFGRSLFKDLAENATISTTENKEEKYEKPSVKSETPEKDPSVTENGEVVNKDNTTDSQGNNESAEIKVTWRQSAAGKTKRPPKDFFTPQEESADTEVDHDKEVSLESAEKKAKKRNLVPTPPVTLNLNLKATKPPQASRTQISSLQAVRAATGSYPQKTVSQSKDHRTKFTNKQNVKLDQQGVDEKHDVEEVKENESDNEAELEKQIDNTDEGHTHTADEPTMIVATNDNADDEEPSESPKPILEPIQEEPIEDNSEDSSSEYRSVKSEEKTKKPVVIKVVPPSKYAEKLQALLADEGQPPQALEVLQPDAIANLKRELARKGIIESYSDELNSDAGEALHNIPKETSETSSEIPTTADDADANTLGDFELTEDGLKDDKRDGYKTNKSFEIRRLQAKAEREREEKRRILFPKPRFLKGSKVNNVPDKDIEDGENEKRRDGNHRKNWVRKKPKSILKMQPANAANGEKGGPAERKRKKRTSATVRIKEPEYEYKVYSDGASDSNDSLPSQSSSVLGYRPNSATSLSTDSSLSFADDDVSFGSSYFKQGQHDWDDDENAFYRTSALGMTVHDIYDDIDRLNPSRLTNAILPESPEQYQERRNRVTSADASVLDRSSLHALRDIGRNHRGRPTASRSSARYPSAIRKYEDKPLHLFDAMRYESDRKHIQQQWFNRGFSRESTDPANRINARNLSRESRRSRQSKGVQLTDGAIAFGPHMAPIPGDKPNDLSETEWVNRVQRFLATAHAGRRKQDEQRKNLRKTTNFTERFLRKIKFKNKKKKRKNKPKKRLYDEEEEIIMPAICYCECCPSCCFACLPDSLCSSMIILFVPTIILTSCLLFIIFWVSGILPI